MAKGDESWTVSASRELADYRIFKALELSSLGPHGKAGRFVVLDAPDWAVVVPVLERDGRRLVVAVRQYRHGAGVPMMEFPGGVVEPGEEPAEAARRELLEETGYAAASVERLGSCSPNPAFMRNAFHVFLATGLERAGEQSLDEHELVDVELVPEDELLAALGTPPWSHALMLTAGFYYLRSRDSRR